VKRGEGNKNSPELSLKIFAFSLPSQPFLGHYFGVHIFFYNSILGGHTFFYSWAVFGLDNIIIL